MSLAQEIQDESELAKIQIANSNLDESFKKSMMRLLHISTIATNGITSEEKIQKMTEAIHLLVVSQVGFVTTVDKKVTEAIEKANGVQCQSCKAMAFVNKAEQEKREAEIIDKWKRKAGIDVEDSESTPSDWKSTLRLVLLKPYVYVVLAIMFASPYAADILKMIFNYFAK